MSQGSKEETLGGPEIREIPLLAIRNTVIFPVLAFPINVGREKSLRSVDTAMEGERLLGIVAQKDAKVEDPRAEDVFTVGTAVKILKLYKMPGNKQNVIIQGLSRIRVLEYTQTEPFLKARVEMIPEPTAVGEDVEGLLVHLREQAQKIIELSPHIPGEASFLVRSIDNPGILADIVASNLSVGVEEKQDLLETLEVRPRLEKVITLLNKEIQVLELSNKIQSEVKGEMDKAQREYFLREQMKAIQKELGEVDDRQEEFEDLKRAIKRAKMPKDVEKIAFKELKRMSRMSPGAAEYTVSRTYIDWLIELPWSVSTEDSLDIDRAAEILDEDHYDLSKVKQRILEYLAVRKLKKDMKGPILCLVGPPGVGKTSLGKSVARALGRKFVRMSLGGVRDEAEIRGHRRTYIGSLPGKIVKGIKKAGSNNPVFILDEIDKLGMDYRGDPSSALLEVLDPEQNDTFQDHYLDVSFDLSKVLFIATANLLSPIPPPLLDRMEVLHIPGYTEEEKVKIAQRFLLPENLEEHGLTARQCEVTEAALLFIIRSYTKEAGVRNLKREIAGICRSVAKDIASGKSERVRVDPEQVSRILGPVKIFSEVAERTAYSGVATGLAVNAYGGDILFIEATAMKGHGKMILTGQLGDVMKESAQAAMSFVRSRAKQLGLADDLFDNTDIHVHVPAGALPKDGPSAGIALMTAITSLLSERTVDNKLAMTGEITLRGHVLPVGGIKEKVLAAARAGIERVILPEQNKKDLPDLTEDLKIVVKDASGEEVDLELQQPGPEVKTHIEIFLVKGMDEVLRLALGDDVLAARSPAKAGGGKRGGSKRPPRRPAGPAEPTVPVA
ncbi:endopeptidase La [Myxococcota bacterium]|nr:endopeptidase La [Myxococcota bacterium]